ncbi:hypothetical protein H2203_002079 [Taxawa tesnikishii (nom. ined.)]|nr:hypothetical protein H2203_002079 [Dothideales sp. JES 119]
MSSPNSITSVPGVLHHIPPITAFEPTSRLQRSLNVNTLIWIGGLFDTYLNVSYPYTLAQQLPPNWSLVQILLSSSAHGWGTGSLNFDVAELGRAVAYFKVRRPGGKVVLMGHSTGCQDGLHYAVSPVKEGLNRPQIEGLILQAPVSDREAIVKDLSAEIYDATNGMAARWISQGKGEDCLPLSATKRVFGSCPVSARRWISLASPGPDHAGEDDLFSSDLSLERLRSTFGKMPPHTPLLLLYGGSDEYVPSHVDREALIRKWVAVVKEGNGNVDETSAKLLEGATHNLNKDPENVVQELCSRVIAFLRRLDEGDFEASPKM